jgi:hypothetical protein
MAQETLPPTTSPGPAAASGRGMALALATAGFAVNFWACRCSARSPPTTRSCSA